jgi:GntR family transcriptional regulator
MMPSTSRSPQRPARRIRDALRARILAGTYGEQSLPSEAELATPQRASRNIVRDVLALLRAEGLIERIPGVGTFRGV